MFSTLPFPVHYLPRVDKPWIILLHGLGMSEKSWMNPFSETLAGGLIPFDFVLTDFDHPPERLPLTHSFLKSFCTSTPLRLLPNPPFSFWDCLAGGGFGLIAWRQRDPLASITLAVEELQGIMERLPAGGKVVFLAHSRGGLVGRRFLQERLPGWDRVKGVILLGCPNRGSRVAALASSTGQARFLAPLEKMLPKSPTAIQGRNPRKSILQNFSRLPAYLRKAAIVELAPHSPLISDMVRKERRERENGIPYFNIMGNLTTYLRIHRILKRDPLLVGRGFSLLDGLEGLIPGAIFPEDLRQGRGDGQVSVERAHLPWAQSNEILRANHARLLVDRSLQLRVLQILGEI